MATLVNGSHTHCHARGVLEKRNPHFNKHSSSPPPAGGYTHTWAAATGSELLELPPEFVGAVAQLVAPELLLCFSHATPQPLLTKASPLRAVLAVPGCCEEPIPHRGFPHPFLPTAGYWGIYLGRCLVCSRLSAFMAS